MLDHKAIIVRRRRLVLGVAAVVSVGNPPSAQSAKADKRDFFYQDKPKEGRSCASCRLFTPGDGGAGRCAIVDGDVSASGWCMAYSRRD